MDNVYNGQEMKLALQFEEMIMPSAYVNTNFLTLAVFGRLATISRYNRSRIFIQASMGWAHSPASKHADVNWSISSFTLSSYSRFSSSLMNRSRPYALDPCHIFGHFVKEINGSVGRKKKRCRWFCGTPFFFKSPLIRVKSMKFAILNLLNWILDRGRPITITGSPLWTPRHDIHQAQTAHCFEHHYRIYIRHQHQHKFDPAMWATTTERNQCFWTEIRTANRILKIWPWLLWPCPRCSESYSIFFKNTMFCQVWVRGIRIYSKRLWMLMHQQPDEFILYVKAFSQVVWLSEICVLAGSICSQYQVWS